MINSIPLDLFYEIFSRLPGKSVGRCRCVSKQWRSILCSADFTKYFSTNTPPSLLFATSRYRNNSEILFLSSPQIQSKSSSLSLAAAYFKLNLRLKLSGHTSGLFCFRCTLSTAKDTEHYVICNPSLGQHVFLPKLKMRSRLSFLGFDPIDKVFKVFSPVHSYLSSSAFLLTLGTGERRWRQIHFPLDHSPESKGICINGALYYLAQDSYENYFIVCFDVRSEKSKLIQEERFIDSRTRLINYKGKLGVIRWPGHYTSGSQVEVCIWVLEDDEKQDWSEYAYTLHGDKLRDVECDVLEVYVAGATSATGEIVLMNKYHHLKPFYVFYFHPERNVIRRVEVQGFEDHGILVDFFVDHVDDLTLDIKSWQLDK